MALLYDFMINSFGKSVFVTISGTILTYYNYVVNFGIESEIFVELSTL